MEELRNAVEGLEQNDFKIDVGTLYVDMRPRFPPRFGRLQIASVFFGSLTEDTKIVVSPIGLMRVLKKILQ